MVFRGTITIEWNGQRQPLKTMVFRWFWVSQPLVKMVFRWLATIGPTMKWLHTIVEVYASGSFDEKKHYDLLRGVKCFSWEHMFNTVKHSERLWQKISCERETWQELFPNVALKRFEMILASGIKGWQVSRNIFLVLSFWKEALLIGLAGLVSGSGGGTVCKRLSRPKQGSTVSNKHQQQQQALDQTPDPRHLRPGR